MTRQILQMGLAALLATAGTAQTRDAAAVLADMRTALGGNAALDAVQAFSVSGSLTSSSRLGSKGFSLELFAMLPSHFMEVKRDPNVGGPVAVDITYYRGFRADEVIRRTDSTIPFPQDPGPQTPDAIAKRERAAILANKREFARLFLVLFGKSPEAYPLQFKYAGADLIDKHQVEILDATSTDGYAMRLFVDAATHLPARIWWESPPTVTFMTSSTVTTRGGQIVSQTPPSPLPAGDPTQGLPLATRLLVVSDFKLQDGLNWPHRWRELENTKVTADTRFGKFKLNPKIDARKFEIR